MNMKQIMACCFGFTTNKIEQNGRVHPLVIFWRYRDLSDLLYPGSWDNILENPKDPKSKIKIHAHRHDQSVLSFLVNAHGYDILDGHKSYFIYEHFKQVPEFQTISPSVCLVSR